MPQETQNGTQTSTQSGPRFDPKTLDSLLQTGIQIAGGIASQRAASGKSTERQERIAACGRRPLFNRAKKAEYDKCVANSQQSKSVVTPQYTEPTPDTGSNNTTRNIIIGVVVLAALVGGFFAVKKIMNNK